MRVMAPWPETKAIPIMGNHTTPEHMNIPALKSIVLTSGSKAVLRWKFHRHQGYPLQATYGCRVPLRGTPRQET
jgi:hypothetical protein